MSRTRATIEDVAKAAGVSRQTVSRVLNRASNVSVSARERVEAAMAELGYVPNLAARRMGGGRSHTLLVLMEAHSGAAAREMPLGDMLLGGMESCSRSGYHLMFDQIERGGEGLSTQLARVLGAVEPDGVVVLPPLDDWSDLHTMLAARQMRTACLGQRTEFGRTVPGLDQASFAESAAQHLVDQGHRQIGYLTGPSASPTTRRRIEGYRRALAAARSRAHRHFVAEAPSDYPAALDLARGWLAPTIRPTAIIADTAQTAIAVEQVALELGIAIPRELSLLSLEDAPALDRARPAITALHLPFEAMFVQACVRLITPDKMAGGEDAPESPSAHLTERQSIARAPRAV